MRRGAARPRPPAVQLSAWTLWTRRNSCAERPGEARPLSAFQRGGQTETEQLAAGFGPQNGPARGLARSTQASARGLPAAVVLRVGTSRVTGGVRAGSSPQSPALPGGRQGTCRREMRRSGSGPRETAWSPGPSPHGGGAEHSGERADDGPPALPARTLTPPFPPQRASRPRRLRPRVTDEETVSLWSLRADRRVPWSWDPERQNRDRCRETRLL